MSWRVRLTGTIDALRPGGNDLDVSAGRSRERYRRAALTSAAGIVSRSISTLGLLIAIGVVNNAVGSEALGVWVLLVSAVALLGFADLGIGHGLLNHLVRARGSDNIVFAQRAVSSAFFALFSLAIVLGVALALVFKQMPWEQFLALPSGLAADGKAAIGVFLACIIVSLPLAVAQRVHLALQEGYWAHVWSTVASVTSLVAVVLVAHTAPSLPLLTLAMLGGTPIAYLVHSIVLFGFQHRELRPRIAFFRCQEGIAILKTGSLFFVLALAYSIGFQSDTVVIAHFLGPEAVATYNVPLRLFLLTPMLTLLLATPLWPAYGEAIAREDYMWVRGTILRSVRLTLALTMTASVFLVAAAKPIIGVWVPALDPSFSLLAWMGVWAVVYAVSSTLAMFLNGASVMRLQIILASTMAITNLITSIVLVQRLGVEGPVIGSVATQTVVVLIPMIIVLLPVLRAHDDATIHRWLKRWARTAHPSDLPVSSTPPRRSLHP